MTEVGWSDPPFRKLPLGAPGIEVAYRGPSVITEHWAQHEFSVWLNGVHYTDPSTAQPEALAVWQRYQESLNA